MISGVLLLILLILFLCQWGRDGRAFFSDPLRVAEFIIVVVVAIITWWPLRGVR